MTATGSAAKLVGTLLLCAALIFAGQFAAGRSMPSPEIAETGRLLGRAGFAYLSGLRTFGAAVLWNRLDPQFHLYYSGVQLHDMQFMMPTMRMVVLLDPQFLQAYQVASYIVFQKEGHEQGLAIAREGVEKNPRSGMMHANLAQLLLLTGDDANRGEALRSVAIGTSSDAYWTDPQEEYEGLAIMRSTLKVWGDPAAMAEVEGRLAKLRSDGAAESVDHDHDGDGKQDH